MFCRVLNTPLRGGSRAAATSKMECFVIIVNGFQPLNIITKHSILDVAAVLDPPLPLKDDINTHFYPYIFLYLNLLSKNFEEHVLIGNQYIAFKSRLFMVTIYNSNFFIFMGHIQCQYLFNKLIHLAKKITFLFLIK